MPASQLAPPLTSTRIRPQTETRHRTESHAAHCTAGTPISDRSRDDARRRSETVGEPVTCGRPRRDNHAARRDVSLVCQRARPGRVSGDAGSRDPHRARLVAERRSLWVPQNSPAPVHLHGRLGRRCADRRNFWRSSSRLAFGRTTGSGRRLVGAVFDSLGSVPAAAPGELADGEGQPGTDVRREFCGPDSVRDGAAHAAGKSGESGSGR